MSLQPLYPNGHNGGGVVSHKRELMSSIERALPGCRRIVLCVLTLDVAVIVGTYVRCVFPGADLKVGSEKERFGTVPVT